MLTETAPAKINIALHITSQRPDGYHIIDSFVVFTEFGDQIFIEAADVDSFSCTGGFCDQLAHCADGDNLILKARDQLRLLAQDKGLSTGPVALKCEKNIPITAGLGGGSADAAATIRVLLRHWDLSLDVKDIDNLAQSLGADVPMCLKSKPLIAKGIGDIIVPIDRVQHCHIVLVNPLIHVSTPEVFKALEQKNNSAMDLPSKHEEYNCQDILLATRNDLQKPAEAICPEITHCLKALSKTDCQAMRMSGSGASCFAIYSHAGAAQIAAEQLKHDHPIWFVHATELIKN